MEASGAQIKELYSQGGPEADESTNIFFVPVLFFALFFRCTIWSNHNYAKVSDVSKNQLEANLKNRSEFVGYWANFQQKIKRNIFQIDSSRQGKHRAFKTALDWV